MKPPKNNGKRAAESGKDISRDLIEASSLVEGGLEMSLKELQRTANCASSLIQRNEEAELKALDKLDKVGIDQIDRLEGQIGYLVVAGNTLSHSEFDEVAKPLEKLLERIRISLSKADAKMLVKLGDLAGEIEIAWRDLQRCLAVVRMQIAIRDASKSGEVPRHTKHLASLLSETAESAEKISDSGELSELIDSLEAPLSALVGDESKSFYDFLDVYAQMLG